MRCRELREGTKAVRVMTMAASRTAGVEGCLQSGEGLWWGTKYHGVLR